MQDQKTVLVVDDQLTNLAFLSMILEKEGYHVLLAKSGAKARDIALQEKPDLILLDVTMPEWDGYETCRRLKQEAALVEIPVLFLSALNDADHKLQAFEAGGVDYVSKPFQEKEMLARVRTHVELYRLREKLEQEIAQRDAQLLAYATDLENKIEERTRELMVAKDEAETANIAKSQFLANMSHELRTPMNAIIGYTEIILEDILEAGCPDFSTDLEKIRESARHLLGLINDVLDISKIESGKMQVYLEEFDVDRLIREVRDTVGPLMARKNNIFHVDLHKPLGAMTSDVVKTKQILINLLSNAAKFTEQGEIRLKVSRLPSVAPNASEQMQFCVSDNGIGMSQEQTKKLFKPFSQADASTTRRFGGTGLGLAISKEFAELMGGSIVVESEFGAGSTFSVTLPVAVKVDALLPEQVASQPLLDPDEDDGVVDEEATSGILLAVMPDRTLLELLRDYFDKLHYPLAIATSHARGALLAKKLRPDLILVAMQQADGGNGWDLYNELKAENSIEQIPIIMTQMPSSTVLADPAGRLIAMTRPVSNRQLSAVIAELESGGRLPSDSQSVALLEDERQGLFMVLEDEEFNRELLGEKLQAQGWDVSRFRNETQLRESLLKGMPAPAWIALDAGMYNVQAQSCIQGLRAIPACATIPLIVFVPPALNSADLARLHGEVENMLRYGPSGFGPPTFVL